MSPADTIVKILTMGKEVVQMSPLKRLAVSVLSFFLFLSLSVFGLALTLNQTILNPDFVVSEVEKHDLAPLVQEFVWEQAPEDAEFMAEYVEDAVVELEPWIKEQASILTYATYDYLKGRSQSLEVVISLETAKDNLKDNARQAFLESPPPELTGATPAELEQYFNEFYQQFTEDIPSTFDESSIPADVQAKLVQARKYIGYFELGYKVLIGFIPLLILGIILINRQVRSSTRELGIVCLSCGVPWLVGIFVVKYLAGTQIARLGLFPYLQELLPELINDCLAPLLMFSIGLAVAGVVLIIVSIVYRRKPSF